MIEGYEKSIRIQLSPKEGNVEMFVKFGDVPREDSYHWHTTGNLIVIKP